METRGRTQDGNGDRSGGGNESSSGDGSGSENGNEDRTRVGGNGGEEAHKQPNRRFIHHVENGGDLGGKKE